MAVNILGLCVRVGYVVTGNRDQPNTNADRSTAPALFYQAVFEDALNPSNISDH